MHRTNAQRRRAEDASKSETQMLEQLNALGHEMYKQKKYDTAAAIFRRCMMVRPKNGGYAVNYASVLWHLSRYDEAARVLEEQIAAWPDYDAGRENYGKVLTTLEHFGAAEAQFNIVINRDPKNKRVVMQRGFSRLDAGNWKGGLDDYEARLEVTEYQKFPMPMWNGEDLAGKTLYVQSEQGAGDTILFSRYLWWIKQTWPTCTIKLCCAEQLLKVLWEYQAQGVLTFMPAGIPWKDNQADYGIYLASLPRLHGTRQDNVPLDPGLIEQRCSGQGFDLAVPQLGNPLKVGICWTGNPEMVENQRRSVPVEKMIDLSGDPRWLFYSLQCGPGRDQLYEHMGQETMADLSPYVGQPHGFVATGACMAKLDLVITVCTSMAHLAGAMGVPTWLLLMKEPYWVWGRKAPPGYINGHGMERTPWYPSMRVFRQPEFGDWTSVMAQVREELGKLYETI